MKKKFVFIALILISFIILVSCVSAYESLSGDITAPPTTVSNSYTWTSTADAYVVFSQIKITNAEYITSLPTLIHFDRVGYHAIYAGSDISQVTSFTATDGISGVPVGSGTIGYQRKFNLAGAEIEGFQWIAFSTWNTSYSGTHNVYLAYTSMNWTAGKGRSAGSYTVTPPTGYIVWGTIDLMDGDYLLNTHFDFVNSYIANKGLGLGIVGTVWKNGFTDSTIHNSRAFVINATNDQIVTSEAVLSSNSLSFDIPTESIYIAVRASNNIFYNSSTLFTTATQAPPIYCSFTALPHSGASPLSITFADTSTGSPTSWDWLIKNNSTGFTEQIHSTFQSSSATLHNPDTYNINFTATNAYHSCSIFYPNYFTVTNPGAITINVLAYDAISHNAISGATVGIQNVTSNIWKNATAPTGSYTFISSDGTSAIPLSIGQTLYAGATATGYTENGHAFSIPYSGYSTSIALMPITAVNATGTFWLTVTVTKNEDGLPLNSAVVQVLSGGNSYQHYTGSNGMTTFQNITSGYTFSVTAFAQAYQAQTKVLPKDADFMNTSFSLVRMGATPVTTPVSPTPTGTPTPIYTNPAGQIISAPEGQAADVFARIAAALSGWAGLAIGIVELTLLWMLVYAVTGGDIINKIMKRGRGGRK